MKIYSFLGLRFFLSLFVFVTHSQIFGMVEKTKDIHAKLNLGCYSVTLFLIISGFCLYLGYSTKFENLSSENLKSFIKKRFIKLYPAYLISNIFVFIMGLIVDLVEGPCSIMTILRYVYHNLIPFFSVIFMVQSWIPKLCTSGNSASWFISTIFFCYLITPFVIHYYNKLIKKCPIIIVFLTVSLTTIFGIPKLSLFIKGILGMSSESYAFFFYTFPPFRFFDFLYGIVLCHLFIKIEKWTKENVNGFVFSLMEAIILVLFFFISGLIKSNLMFYLYYSLFVLAFAMDKGIISRICATRPAIWLGSTSLYFYLFHYPVITRPLYFSFYKSGISTRSEETIFVFALVYYSTGFILSYLATYLYDKASPCITDKIENLMKKKNVLEETPVHLTTE